MRTRKGLHTAHTRLTALYTRDTALTVTRDGQTRALKTVSGVCLAGGWFHGYMADKLQVTEKRGL